MVHALSDAAISALSDEWLRSFWPEGARRKQPGEDIQAFFGRFARGG